MSGDDERADTVDGADTADDEQEVTLTFSYDPQATLDDLFGIGEETLFHAFDLALARVGVTESVEVSVLITTDEGIQTLNREYRGKDEPTDVLSFPLLDHPLVDAPDDQLWQPPDAERDEGEDGDSTAAPHSFFASVEPEAGEEEFADDFTDFADDAERGDQSLKGMIVIMGDDGDEEDNFADGSETWPTHLGDIAISRETALRQAQQAGHSAAYEVAFLFVHGVLHLVGFDDHTDAGYHAM
ncbi:MAG TPA: rRNA maturation RNase YbeY, partial [Ktedonobacterales bacterium]